MVPAFEHEFTYGHRPRGAPVELVDGWLSATVPRPALRACARAHTPSEARTVRFADRTVGAPVLAREMLASDATPGPILIEEYDSVILVPPQARASLDHHNVMRTENPVRANSRARARTRATNSLRSCGARGVNSCFAAISRSR